mmetsp:Transcript_152770/g.281655  ORF Transcript_152770/g.281655 Transcript_152770/m.281655 type:complete len:454 (-) Transcript_152770:138-1499(-)
MSDGCSSDHDGPDLKWILGISACVVGSSANATGFVLQKWAHLANAKLEQLPDRRPYPEKIGMLCSPLWMAGFMLTVVLSLPVDLVSMMMIPQTVHAPMSGITIIMGQIVAPCILNERTTKLDWLATVLITMGVGLTTTFGSHCSTVYTVEDIVSLWSNTFFQAIESTAPVLVLLAFLSVRFFIPWSAKDPKVHSRCIAVSYSLVAGVLGGQQNLFFKATAEVLETTVEGNSDEWSLPWPYVFIAGTCVCAIAHLGCINLGMKHWTVVKTFPIYVSSFIVFSTVYGGAFYQEYKEVTETGKILFPVALVIQLFGMVLLFQREPKASEAVIVEPSSKTDMALDIKTLNSDSESVRASLPDSHGVGDTPKEQHPLACKVMVVSSAPGHMPGKPEHVESTDEDDESLEIMSASMEMTDSVESALRMCGHGDYLLTAPPNVPVHSRQELGITSPKTLM